MSIAISKQRRKPAQHPPQRLAAAVPEFPVARMTVPEYLSLVERGFFGSRRVELWEGWVIDRMSHGPTSAMIITLLTRWFFQRINDSITLRPQLPIELVESCPEPDIALVQGRPDDFAARHPTPR